MINNKFEPKVWLRPEYWGEEPGKGLMTTGMPLSGWDKWWINLDTLDDSNSLDGEFIVGKDIDLLYPTGLEDSEGVMIYEFDFVEFTYWWFDGHGEAESTLSGYIRYNPDLMSFELVGIKNAAWIKHIGGAEGTSDSCPFAFFNFDSADFTIKGNILETPSLNPDAKLELKKGDKVTYTRRGTGHKENGIVKKNHPDGGKAWVVYNCGGDWDNYRNYTAALTEYDLLSEGWSEDAINYTPIDDEIKCENCDTGDHIDGTDGTCMGCGSKGNL